MAEATTDHRDFSILLLPVDKFLSPDVIQKHNPHMSNQGCQSVSMRICKALTDANIFFAGQYLILDEKGRDDLKNISLASLHAIDKAFAEAGFHPGDLEIYKPLQDALAPQLAHASEEKKQKLSLQMMQDIMQERTGHAFVFKAQHSISGAWMLEHGIALSVLHSLAADPTFQKRFGALVEEMAQEKSQPTPESF